MKRKSAPERSTVDHDASLPPKNKKVRATKEAQKLLPPPRRPRQQFSPTILSRTLLSLALALVILPPTIYYWHSYFYSRRKGKDLTMPAAYTSSQKAAIVEYVSVTQSDKSSAAKVLKQYNWNVSAAANAFFSGGANTASKNPHASTLNKTFDKYRDDPKESPDEINVDGTMQLLQDMQIDMQDVGALIFSELVASPTLGQVTREGFVDGFSSVSADSLPRMRNVVLQRRSALPDPLQRAQYKQIYTHTFTVALQPGSKAVPLESAVEFWRLLFTPPSLSWSSPSTPWIEWWIEFMQSKWKKAINKDLWKQTLSFAEQTLADENLSFWNEESSWPSVIDEFVEWVKMEKRDREEPMQVE